MNNFFSRFFKGDMIIWGIIVILSIISVVEVYSSIGNLAFKYTNDNTSHYILKHTSLLAFGFFVIWVFHNINYKYFSHASKLMLPIATVLLLITILSGSSINHAARWLTIPIVNLSFQPSEFAKISLIAFVARTLSANQNTENPPIKAFKPVAIWTGIICALIAPEDLSSAILIAAIVLLLLFIGRVPYKPLLLTIGGGIVFMILLMLVAPRFEDVSIFHRVNTWRTRIETFSDTSNASQDESYQSDQAKIAISSGGVFGKFLGNSRQSNYLPHPYSDFIYAIIVEEGGLILGLLTIMLYITLLYRALAAAIKCRTSFPLFLITGLTSALVLQAFAHMFVCTGILPVTGQTLPFVSMGGTSIVFTAASLGMILSITNPAHDKKEAKASGEFAPEDQLDQIEETSLIEG